MLERAESIEDGSFWESHYYGYAGEDEFYDGNPDFVSEEQIDELIDLFESAEFFF